MEGWGVNAAQRCTLRLPESCASLRANAAPNRMVWSNQSDQTMKVNVQEAKAQLSRLLDAALAGEEVVIARAGKPVVRLTPIAVADRKPGAAAGKARLTDAFFEPLPASVLADFESDLT
jgi:prevent-host-death family protein